MEDLLVVKNLVQEFKSHSGFLDSIKLKDGRLIREKKAVHARASLSDWLVKAAVENRPMLKASSAFWTVFPARSSTRTRISAD